MSELKALFEKELNMPVEKVELFYSEDRLLLAEADGEMYLWDGSSAFKISSYPYEPCTYLILNGNVFATVHNAFDLREIRNIAKCGGTLHSVSGNDYDIGRLCRLLAFAAADCPDADISYVEGRISVEKLKELGAFSPETAVGLGTLGVRSISSAFSHSKKLAERVMTTEDGKVYVRIKNR